MSFPACPHRKRKSARKEGIYWLGAEPYRIFFLLGILWSVVGVLLWPLFYHGYLSTHPLVTHSRLMIEAFGGAFVIGFIGTAGPRMASAPKLTPAELICFVLLHTAAGLCHLMGYHTTGDLIFAVLLATLLSCLVIRILRFRKEPPPHQLLLALPGLLFGTVGAALLAFPSILTSIHSLRFSSLLLEQGLLLPPVLGIGSFVFPRILGRGFGEASSESETRRRRILTVITMLLIAISFVVDAWWSLTYGTLLRALICVVYLLSEVSWRKRAGFAPMVIGLKLALLTALAGLILSAFADPKILAASAKRISVDHLLYIGGFGLLILIVGGRVLFGHAGQLKKFSDQSVIGWLLVLGAFMTAATRAVPAMVPQLAISHHQYAAILWAIVALLWFVWHSRRFFARDNDDDDDDDDDD